MYFHTDDGISFYRNVCAYDCKYTGYYLFIEVYFDDICHFVMYDSTYLVVMLPHRRSGSLIVTKLLKNGIGFHPLHPTIFDPQDNQLHKLTQCFDHQSN